jgi:hypothetical protein
MPKESKNRSSISNAKSYWEIGEFWDTHDLTDYWDKTRAAEFDVDIQAEVTYYAIDRELSDGLQRLSEQRGISPETLLNLWVQENLKKSERNSERQKQSSRRRKAVTQ